MVALVYDPIDADAIAQTVRSPSDGAVVIFNGVVREGVGNQRIAALFYEAYETVALAEMNAIAQEVHARFAPCNLSMVHRLGRLSVGETSVAVAVATPHRSGAFEACRYAIDNLKARVAIWKKEEYADGGARWCANALSESAR